MINSGTPVHIVQRYLGHASPEMTMSYAHIHDSTMKEEYLKYQGKLVNHKGASINVACTKDLPEELKWLKANVLAQALPNGYCALPTQQGGCPHANACLSCTSFRTSGNFIPQHKQQLAELEKITKVAKEHGRTRQVEMNSTALNNLKKILVTLETTEV
jgi:integrase/recombinase XerD